MIIDENILLTIDVGNLPLDTTHWNNIRILSHTNDFVSEVNVENVKFISDEPISYFLHLMQRDENGEASNAMYSEKWYETPSLNQRGGENVVIKVKNPNNNNINRSLLLNNKELKTVIIYDDYLEYEFIMPFKDVSITIVDKVK